MRVYGHNYIVITIVCVLVMVPHSLVGKLVQTKYFQFAVWQVWSLIVTWGYIYGPLVAIHMDLGHKTQWVIF